LPFSAIIGPARGRVLIEIKRISGYLRESGC
jgi:hypothetical protein